VVVSRDAILLAGTLIANLTETNIDISPTLLGKGTTLAQICYVIAVMLHVTGQVPDFLVDPVLWVMVALTMGSGVHYLLRGVQHLNGSSGKTDSEDAKP